MSKGKAITIGRALDRTEELMSILGDKARIAGSLRRKYESEDDRGLKVNDVDVVVARQVEESEVAHLGQIIASGPKKIRIVLPMPDVKYDEEDEIKGLQVDIVMCEPDEFGACLLYLTGPYHYNVEMRGYAKSKGLKLNEKGLWKDDERVAGKTEQSIYKALGLPWTRAGARDELRTFKKVPKWSMTVESSRKGHDPYEVVLTMTDEWVCRTVKGVLCKGYQHSKKNPKVCRHITKHAIPAYEAEMEAKEVA